MVLKKYDFFFYKIFYIIENNKVKKLRTLFYKKNIHTIRRRGVNSGKHIFGHSRLTICRGD